MIPKILRLELKSAATFGRGDGVAGLVDREIEHDRFGFPFLRGRTLKGLLAESAENVVYALELQRKQSWRDEKKVLFGESGRGLNEQGMLHVSDARLPQSLRLLLQSEQRKESSPFTRESVLQSLTSIRRQTSVNPAGGSDHGSLRAMRVLLTEVVLHAELHFRIATEPSQRQLGLLAATVLDFRRAGTGRNRGRGWLEADLIGGNGEVMTKQHFQEFVKQIN